jgi:hypothetical protein
MKLLRKDSLLFRASSEGLFELSNDMDTYGEDRLRRKKIISKALRIPENTL